jgi:hypothetical protein
MLRVYDAETCNVLKSENISAYGNVTEIGQMDIVKIGNSYNIFFKVDERAVRTIQETHNIIDLASNMTFNSTLTYEVPYDAYSLYNAEFLYDKTQLKSYLQVNPRVL